MLISTCTLGLSHYTKHMKQTKQDNLPLVMLGKVSLIFLSLLVSATVSEKGSCLFAQVNTSPISPTVAEEQDFAFAYGLYKDGVFKLASEQFEKFESKYPSSPKLAEAKFLKLECWYQLEQYDATITGLSKFVKEYPSSLLTVDAYFRLGETYLRVKKQNEAVSAFKAVLENFGDKELAGEATYWIGESYARIEDYDNALKYYTLAYENYPKSRLRDYVLYSVGWTFQRKREYAKASEWYQRFIDEFPQSSFFASVKVRVGECYYHSKDYQRAIDELTKAKATISETQERGETEYLIGEAYYHLEQYSEARKHYEQFLSEYPGHKLEREVLYALGWTLLKQSEFQRAAEVFDKLISGNDQLAHAGLFRRGIAEKFVGNSQAAVKTFTEVVTRSPQGEFSDNALYEVGLIEYENKNFSAAKKLFDRVVAEYPTSDVLADAYRMAGECLLADSKYDPALTMFEKALEVPSASLDVKVAASYQSAWCSYKLKDYKGASEKFTRLINSYPQHPRTVDGEFWLAESEYQLGNYQSALAHYQTIAAKPAHEKKEDALYGIAWSYFKLNEFSNAASGFERLIASYPNGRFSFDAHLRLGDSYFLQKDFQKASGVYRTVQRLYANRDGVDYAYFQLGQAYHRMGNFDQARQQFTSLLKLFPNSPLADDAQYALGWIRFQTKEYAEAIKEFRKLIVTYPASELVPRAHYSIGDAYYNLQQYSDAEKSYREVLEQFPKSAYITDALTGIQYCLIAQGKQQEAVAVIDGFIQQQPDLPVVEELYLKKGDLLYSQERYDDAAREFETFALKFPKSKNVATALYWSAKSLQARGRNAEAAVMFERASKVPNASPKIASNTLLEAGRIYLAQKQYDQALNTFARVEKEFGDGEVSAEASLMKGMVFWENGDLQEAKNQLEFVISKDVSKDISDRARIAMVKIYLKTGNSATAQTLTQKVATSRTDDLGAEAQYLSGVAYGQAKDWQNAITAYMRVRYVFPAYEQWLTKAYLGLGITYEELKDLQRAKSEYQNVLKLGKDDESVMEAQRRLKNLERL